MGKTKKSDVRWVQRLQSYSKALSDLGAACQKSSYTKLERSGLIQTFEFTFELAWKTLQDLLMARGYADVVGPKPVLQQSFQDGLLSDGEVWMEMLRSRNMTTHIYQESVAEEIARLVKTKYFPLLKKLHERLEKDAP